MDILKILLMIAVVAVVPVVMWLTSRNKPTVLANELMFNGVYIYRIDQKTQSFLRFYADGTVLITSSPDKPEPAFTWFAQEKMKELDLSNGRYQLQDVNLSFFCDDNQGNRIDCKGTIAADILTLDYKNARNDQHETRMYQFVKVA